MGPLFRIVDTSARAMDYHLRRHNVLASNVANVDTPGFRPRDLVRVGPASSGEAPAMPLATTAERHLLPPGAEPAGRQVREEEVVRPGGDGNAVSLEREMAKIGANRVRYETVGRIVRQQLGLLRYAAQEGDR